MEIVARRKATVRVKKIRRAIRRAKLSIENIFTDSMQHIDDITHKIDCAIAVHKPHLLQFERELVIASGNFKSVYYLALNAYRHHINEKGFLEVNYDNGRKRIAGALSVPMLHRICTDVLFPKQFMWYFEAMIGSSLGNFYIKEYLKYNKHIYTTLVRAFKNYHIPKSKIVEYLWMIHKQGPPMLVDDLQTAFLEYGFKSKEFESFLEANPFFDLRNPPPYPLPEELQQKFWMYVPAVWINYLNYGFPINVDEDVFFRNDFLNQLSSCVFPSKRCTKVPTLQQRAKDVFREYIHNMGPYYHPLAFYNRIRRLNVPNDIKEILLLRDID